MMAGVMCPAIIGIHELGVGWTWPSQGNGALEGRVGSGERAIVSCSSIFFTASIGFVIRSPVDSFFIIERSMRNVLVFMLPAALRRIDLRTVFGFLANILRRVLPYKMRRTFRACLKRSIVAFLRPLKQVCMASWGKVITVGVKVFSCEKAQCVMVSREE